MYGCLGMGGNSQDALSKFEPKDCNWTNGCPKALFQRQNQAVNVRQSTEMGRGHKILTEGGSNVSQ